MNRVQRADLQSASTCIDVHFQRTGLLAVDTGHCERSEALSPFLATRMGVNGRGDCFVANDAPRSDAFLCCRIRASGMGFSQ